MKILKWTIGLACLMLTSLCYSADYSDEIDISIGRAETYRQSGENGFQQQVYTNYSNNYYLRAIALMMYEKMMYEKRRGARQEASDNQTGGER